MSEMSDTQERQLAEQIHAANRAIQEIKFEVQQLAQEFERKELQKRQRQIDEQQARIHSCQQQIAAIMKRKNEQRMLELQANPLVGRRAIQLSPPRPGYPQRPTGKTGIIEVLCGDPTIRTQLVVRELNKDGSKGKRFYPLMRFFFGDKEYTAESMPLRWKLEQENTDVSKPA